MTKRSLPGRPRNAHVDDAWLNDANLDDLLMVDESQPVARVPHRQRPWLVRSVVQAVILSAVIFAAFRIGMLAPPYPLILAVCLGGVLVRRAVGMTAEPASQRISDAVRGPSSLFARGDWYGGGDGMLVAIRRWDRRMEWGAESPERFAATVLLRLGELTDERLRLRHSITRATDPSRARALLGEDLWHLLHDPTGRIPKPREIAAAARRLESL
jgi:hypothetical protein